MLSSANTAVIYFEPHCVKLGLRYLALYDKYAVNHMLRGTFAFPPLFLFRLRPCGPVMVTDRGQSYTTGCLLKQRKKYIFCMFYL